MNGEPNYKIYCLSYNNEERKNDMIRRFNTLNLDVTMYEGVHFTDERIKKYFENDMNNAQLKKILSCAYGHLDMIKNFFYNTDKEFGIFSEDDIFIHKELRNYLPQITKDAKTLNLDVLLLGYLTVFKVESIYDNFKFKPGMENIVHIEDFNYNYHEYPDNCWGTQMYMLSREHVKKIVEKYTDEYINTMILENKPFVADFVFTKEGNRALISPILVTEDNKTVYDCEVQETYHKNSFLCHFDKDLFIT